MGEVRSESGGGERNSGKGLVNDSTLAWIHSCIVVSVDDEGKNATLANRILNTANGGKYFVMMSSFFKVIVVSCLNLRLKCHGSMLLALVIHRTLPSPPPLERSGNQTSLTAEDMLIQQLPIAFSLQGKVTCVYAIAAYSMHGGRL